MGLAASWCRPPPGLISVVQDRENGMSATGQQTVLVGNLADRDRAEHFVTQLRRAGFSGEQIGVALPDDRTTPTPVEESALAGALTGGTVGILAGLGRVSPSVRERLPGPQSLPSATASNVTLASLPIR